MFYLLAAIFNFNTNLSLVLSDDEGSGSPPVESILLLNSGGGITLNSGGNLLLNS